MTSERCVLYAVIAAEKALPEFEEIYPEDDRPRRAIEVAKQWMASGYQDCTDAADSALCGADAATEAALLAGDYAAAAAADATAFAVFYAASTIPVDLAEYMD